MQGDIQDLIVTDNPGTAYEICEVYCPECDVPLPYGATFSSSFTSTVITSSQNISSSSAGGAITGPATIVDGRVSNCMD